jgi:elongation factor P
MISTNDVRPGMALALHDGLFAIVQYNHVKPGKGKAFVKMKLKKLSTGQVMERTFRADENVDRAIVDKRDFQYLFRDDLGFHVMDLEDYSQMAISDELCEAAAPYLVDGDEVILAMYEGTPIGVELPSSVILEVQYAEPGVKGDRVSGGTKPVTMETGLVVNVPLFIETGEKLKIDTRTGEYMTRT